MSRALLLTLLLVALTHSTRAGELERFWSDFPGFKNTLASYGYDRGFSRSAKPEFVDAIVKDFAANPSQRRLGEYLCVLYHMDRKTVSDRLSRLDSSSSPDTRRASATVRTRLEQHGRDPISQKK
jgi:hypothetical protein